MREPAVVVPFPPEHPESPVVFESVAFSLNVTFSDQDVMHSLVWEQGRPRWKPGTATLSVAGPRSVVIPYLCGLLDSHHLFRATRVEGDVASLSALHGLTHHHEVELFWASRWDEISAAIAGYS